jgi:hypothetical protein
MRSPDMSLPVADPLIDPAIVHRTLPIGWAARDFRTLETDLAPYVGWIRVFLGSGDPFPSHIAGSGSIAVPVADPTTPEELFAALGEALGEGVRFECREYAAYWVTTHYPNPEPVVTLVPKILPGIPPSLTDLCGRCSEALGATVGGIGGMFLACLLPGFSWAMHTDHDNLYEQTAARVHVPIKTSPLSEYVWGRKLPDGREDWQLCMHLPAGEVHYVRVDVPHTVVNRHPTDPRLHLILDVH